MIKPSSRALNAERQARREKLLSHLQQCIRELRDEGLMASNVQQVRLHLSPRDGNLPSLKNVQFLSGGFAD